MGRRFRVRRIDVDDGPGEVDSQAQPDMSPELAALCQRLRDIYVIECRRSQPGLENYGSRRMPAWDGGVDDFGRERESVWPKLARFIASNGFDPVRYIRSQFQATRYETRIPLPTTLMTDSAVSRYRASLANTVSALQLDLQNQRYSLQVRLAEFAVLRQYTPLQHLEMAIADERSVQASPLFRYCVASSAGLERLVQYFRSAALSQYVFQQEDYDTAWGNVIPYALRTAATELRQRMNY